MGILTQEEFEKSLFDAINKCYQNRKRLLELDFQCFILPYFDDNFDAYKEFLEQLLQRGYIKLDGPRRLSIVFGDNALEWRKRMENAFPDQSQQISNQTFNISSINNMQAAGRDINNFNHNDAEQLIEVLKHVIPHNSAPNSLSQKVRSWLDCGSSAVDILKGIASLM